MHVRRLCVLAIVWMLVAGPAWAQSDAITVRASVEPTEVGTEETVRFTIEVRGASLSAVDTPEPPGTTNLVLKESTPSTQRNLSFNSGRLRRSIAFQWTYRPMRVGTARIRPAEVVIDGTTFTTEEIRVRVVPQSQRPARAQGPSRTRSPSGAAPDASQTSIAPRDLFIRASPQTATAFQNEQVTLEYRLFFRPGIQLRHSRLARAWDANGFWREELDVASRPRPRMERAYGQTYRTIVLKRVAVFPTRTGTLRVDPLSIETEAYVSDRSAASDQYSLQSRYEPVTLSSDALQVTARPLPDGAPDGFDGAVGTFRLSTRIETDSARVGEAVRVKAEVSGTGNLSTLQPPSFSPPGPFELYDPKVETDVDRGGSVVRGTKTFTYVLVPQASGDYTLPPVRLTYFNPETEQYETSQSDPASIHVTGDAAPVAVSATKEGLPVGDIAGLATAVPRWERTDAEPLYRQPWAYGALAVPFLVAAGVLAYRRRQGAAPGGAPVAPPPRRQTALATAQRHLQEAHRHLRESETKLFYKEVERAVLGFIGDRLDLPVPGITRPVLDEHLTRYDVSREDRETLHELMHACDQAQFTPAQPSHDSMQAALDYAQSLILRLDDHLPEA